MFDRQLESERKTLFIPAFPIAAWLVNNWWFLFNELCAWESLPTIAFEEKKWQWNQRHCLRTADSSLMLPALYLFHDGRSLRAEWHADEPKSMPNMPGEFVATGYEELDFDQTRQSLGEFIDSVLYRVKKIDSQCVHEVCDTWQAIQSADADEASFCSVAGRMGVDPYDESAMTDEFAEFIESESEDEEPSLFRDLTEVANPEQVVQQWHWLIQLKNELNLVPLYDFSRVHPMLQRLISSRTPYQYGSDLARNLRIAARKTDAPIDSLSKFASKSIGCSVEFENHNHLPGRRIRAMVGMTTEDRRLVVAGPQPSRQDSLRFLLARGVYHAMAPFHSSQRLLTDAFSWDQKASRAFAAELLAPKQALVAAVPNTEADIETVANLSERYKVSMRLIEHQLENAGVSVLTE